MMAAAQPFLSGAISKTINLPNEATVDDIERRLRSESGSSASRRWRSTATAPSSSQPLSTKTRQPSEEIEERRRGRGRRSTPRGRSGPRRAGGELADEPSCPQPPSATRPAASTSSTPGPSPLPAKRRGFTQEARVAGHKVYLRTGEYEDGTLGEIFIDMHKEGAAFRSMMNCFAIAVSKGLQYGVPLEEFVDTFTFTRFEPQGMVERPPEHQDRDLDHRLRLPRARPGVPRPYRSGAGAAGRRDQPVAQPGRPRGGGVQEREWQRTRQWERQRQRSCRPPRARHRGGRCAGLIQSGARRRTAPSLPRRTTAA